jgi:hypothetical protein
MRTTWYYPITIPDFATVGALLTGLVDKSHMCQALTIYKVVWLALSSSLINVIRGDAMCVGPLSKTNYTDLVPPHSY